MNTITTVVLVLALLLISAEIGLAKKSKEQCLKEKMRCKKKCNFSIYPELCMKKCYIKFFLCPDRSGKRF
ncbi:hypothetical protein ScPMuIL_007042 [Solemya velum]